MKRRGRKSDAQLRIQANVEARLEAHRELLQQATDLLDSQHVPTEREMLAALRAAGLPSRDADRIQAEIDKRERHKARTALANDRREAVRELSRQGVPVGEIAAQLGIAYNYVVQLRAELDVPRCRTRR